jgi:methyl-accepting chemotaxis protein
MDLLSVLKSGEPDDRANESHRRPASGDQTTTDPLPDGGATGGISVLDGLGTPTLVLDTEGRVRRCNDPALELYGVAESELIERRPRAVLDDGSETSDLALEAIEAGGAIEDREELFVVDGQETHVSRTIRPVYEAGTCVGAVEIDRDIDDRIQRRRRTAALESYQKAVLADLRDRLAALADGDLTIDPSIEAPDDDFPELQAVYEEFQAMNGDLGRVVENFTEIVETLTAQAAEIADSSDTLSASSEEVTASVQQIDASADEMATGAERLASETEAADDTVDDLSASIEEITATAQQINARSDEAAELTDEGVTGIRDALTEIREATDAASSVAADMDELETHMHHVGEIVQMISDIADQTNILALNANIEAARAETDGEGFAVVANEVKTLAEESRGSADDIGEIIDDAQAMTEQLVASIQDANDRVETGADAVDGAADTIETIRDRIDMTNQGVGEIADAVESQARDAEQVSAVFDDTADMAQDVSAAVQQIAAGIDEQARAMDEVAHRAESLSATGDDIHELVDLFKLSADESASVDEADDIADRQVSTREGTAQKAAAGRSAGTEPDTTGASGAAANGDRDDQGPTKLSPDDFE